MPDDGDLTDLIAEFAPDEGLRRLLPVDNRVPSFGFGERDMSGCA